MKKEPFTKIDTGWLAPNGDFYPADYMEHLSVADELCEIIAEPSAQVDAMPDTYLLQRGWCEILIINYLEHGYLFYYINHLTSEQKRVIKPVFEDYKYRIIKSNVLDLEEELYEN